MTGTQPDESITARNWAQRHPLAGFFIFAFTGTWLLFLPVLLARGFGLFPMEEPFISLFLMLGVFIGPLAASLLMTGVTEGRAGLKAFLRRFMQFRVGLKWYLLVIVGYPVVYLVGLVPVLGAEAYSGIMENLPVAIAVYLPALLIGLIFPSLGEEPGWRGFALPHLQRQLGPLPGTLILGSMVALWHLPIYFIPGFTTLDSFDPAAILFQSGAIIAASITWSWLYNHGGESIFFAMLIHSASNTSPTLVKALLGDVPSNPVFQVVLFGSLALLVIAFTRGRLGYRLDARSK